MDHWGMVSWCHVHLRSEDADSASASGVSEDEKHRPREVTPGVFFDVNPGSRRKFNSYLDLAS